MRKRVVAYAALLILAAYVAAIAFGPWHSAVVTAFVVAAMPVVGILGWSLVGASVLESASWAIPLLIWNGGIYAIRPPDTVAATGFVVGAIWAGAFFSWSPVVPWWYAHVLRRAEPIDPDAF